MISICVKLCFGGKYQMDIDLVTRIISIFVSVIALFISVFSLRDSKKARKELGQAFLSMDLIQTADGLYAMLRNIGKSYAYDVNVLVSPNFVNGFENLSTIQPNNVYRFLLLHPLNISNYPDIVKFTIQYHDYYSPKCLIEKSFEFKIMDCLKFNMEYNKNFNCYDIKKFF